MASWNGHHECVRTLLDHQADVNAKDNVRNQMLIVIIISIISIIIIGIIIFIVIIIVLNIMMIVMIM